MASNKRPADDTDIDFSDIPETHSEFWANSQFVLPTIKPLNPKPSRKESLDEPSHPTNNSRRECLEAIERIVAFFIAGGNHTSEQTLATIIDAPLVSGYDNNNPLLKTLRELIQEQS